jgi:type I restriction enzyme, R subunit
VVVVVNKPKDLTREQLREVRLLLDQHGYSEAKLLVHEVEIDQQFVKRAFLHQWRRKGAGQAPGRTAGTGDDRAG